MGLLRSILCLSMLFALVSCNVPRSTAATPPKVAESATGDADRILLRTGEVVEGRIVEMTQDGVAIESGTSVRIFPNREIAEISKSRREALASAPARPAAAMPPTSWYPTTDPRESMQHVEVTFYADHAWKECLGELTRGLENAPELDLFAPAGGRLVLHDPKRWGYHAHTFPNDLLHKPVGKPGLTIPIPKQGGGVISAVSFVSPAQEMKPIETAQRFGYAVPDAVYARIKPMEQAEAALEAQSFTGGKPRETRLGSLWAFVLPRNDRQFLVYLLDPQGRHGKALSESYAAYGDSLLAPDLMIDVVSAEGTVLGRVLVVPIPPSLSADGPAPEPVSILAGEDGAPLATVAMPPRQAVMLPPRAPAMKVDVQVSFYEVSKDVEEKAVVAYGTGRPTTGIVQRVRRLTPTDADETVRIDLSSQPAEKFPAVAWFYHRRSYAWRDGGCLGTRAAMIVPPLRAGKPSKAIVNDTIPHVLPILFVGPSPKEADAGAGLAEAAVSGGMQGALWRDSLMRGLGQGFAQSVSNVVPQPGGDSGGGASAQNVTNVYIVVPPHTATGGGGLPGMSLTASPTGGGGVPTGSYLFTEGGRDIGAHPGTDYNVFDRSTGRAYDPRTGQTTYDPRNGSVQNSAQPANGNNDLLYVDPGTGAGLRFSRRNK